MQIKEIKEWFGTNWGPHSVAGGSARSWLVIKPGTWLSVNYSSSGYWWLSCFKLPKKAIWSCTAFLLPSLSLASSYFPPLSLPPLQPLVCQQCCDHKKRGADSPLFSSSCTAQPDKVGFAGSFKIDKNKTRLAIGRLVKWSGINVGVGDLGYELCTLPWSNF